MTNKHNGEVSCLIGDDEYRLKLKASDLATAEALLGIDSLIGRALGFRSIQALFFIATNGQHGIKGLEQVAELMDTHMAVVSKAVSEAVDFFYQNQVAAIQDSE